MAAAFARAEDYVDGEVLVKCTEELTIIGSDPPTTGDEELDEVIVELGVYEITELYDLLPEEPITDPNGKWDWEDWIDMVDEERLDTFYTFKYDHPDILPPEAAQLLSDCAIVEIAEPNYRLYPDISPDNLYLDFIPNDNGFYLQWNFHNTGGTGGTVDKDIDAPEGWEYWFPSYPFRTSFVAVVDSGADLNHPDLESNLGAWYNPYEESMPPDDTNGHGSHIAGIITAVTNNYIGVAGTGFNKIKVMPVKVTNWYENEELNERVASRGILWAAQNGADAINLSWGGEAYPAILHRWIRAAYKLGVITCASAGNEHEWIGEGNHRYPACFKEVIMVTATNHDDVITYYSNWGPDTEFCAPGGTPADGILSTIPDDDYGYKNGTSMAAPHISAACAIIQAHYLDAVWPPVDRVANARNILKNSVDDLGAEGWDEYYGWGRLNLDKLMDQVVWDADNRGRGPSAVSRSPIPSDTISQNEGLSSLPAAFRMYQSFPNPAAGTATFKFDLAERDGASHVSLKVYDLAGRCVASVVDENLTPGRYERRWDCTNQYGQVLPAGVYVYRLIAGKNVTAGKLVVNSE